MPNHLRWEIDFGISSVNVNELIRLDDQVFFCVFTFKTKREYAKSMEPRIHQKHTRMHACARSQFTLENSQLAKFFVARTSDKHKYTKTRARARSLALVCVLYMYALVWNGHNRMTTSEFNWQTMPLIDGTWMQCIKWFGNMLNGFENVFKMINRCLCCSKSNCVYIFCMDSHAHAHAHAPFQKSWDFMVSFLTSKSMYREWSWL